MRTTTSTATHKTVRKSATRSTQSKVQTTKATTATPRDGYPTVPGFFQFVSVAELYEAMTTLIKFSKQKVYNSQSVESREIRHQANVLSTFAKTLAANAETLDAHFRLA